MTHTSYGRQKPSEASGHWGLTGHGRCGVHGRPEAGLPVGYHGRDGHGACGRHGRRYGHGDG